MMMPVDPITLFFMRISFIFIRRKTRMELVKLSLSVCGIELAYASETGESLEALKKKRER